MFLETDRIYLRRLSKDDAFFIYTLLNSPGWLEYIGDRGVSSIEKAVAYIEEKYLPSYKDGLGNFCVVQKNDDLPVGTCGLYLRDNLDAPDIGFAFLPEFIGKGYAYEASSALKDYALNDLKLEKLYGFTLPNNVASINLLKKLGLKESGTMQFEDDPEELLLFSI